MILDPSGQPIGRTLNEEEAVQLLIAELQALDATPMEIAFRPFTVMQLAGLLQLALRHPDVSGDHRETAWSFLEAAREYFADAPTVLTVARSRRRSDAGRPAMNGQLRINQLFAFVIVDDDGTEGVIGMRDPVTGMAVAMMGADMARVADLKRIAERDPMLRGRKVTILRFGERETIGTIDRTGEGRHQSPGDRRGS